MRNRLTVLAAMLCLTSIHCAPKAQALMLNGAGATFPYPLYSRWFDAYGKAAPGSNINYQSIGSGGGIRQITERTVDFGASDAPMSAEQMAAAPGILHIPMTLGAVAVVYNLKGVPTGLKLDGATLADIYLGQITKWRDPRLMKLNPGAALPDLPITVVRRSDGSGTTSVFTDFLSLASTRWAGSVGKGTSVNWPVGIGSKGNEGVTGQVKGVEGTIGYVELAYAQTNKLSMAALRNGAGEFQVPAVAGVTAAAAALVKSLPADFRTSLVDAPGKGVYPIASYSYLLVYQDQRDLKKGKILAGFLRWALTEGQKYSEPLSYAPLPKAVAERALERVATLTSKGKPLVP